MDFYHLQKIDFKVNFLCFRSVGVFRFVVLGYLGSYVSVLHWWFLIIFLHWCLGIWVLDNYRPRCWILNLSLFDGCFFSWILFPPWSFWLGFLKISRTSDRKTLSKLDPSGRLFGVRCKWRSLFLWLVWLWAYTLTAMAWSSYWFGLHLSSRSPLVY